MATLAGITAFASRRELTVQAVDEQARKSCLASCRGCTDTDRAARPTAGTGLRMAARADGSRAVEYRKPGSGTGGND